jgi:catechol 2,3-dioxygenase-like lactoylglutathione lyase family enzyme
MTDERPPVLAGGRSLAEVTAWRPRDKVVRHPTPEEAMTSITPLASNVFQIAYVVPDLHAAVRFFKEKLGVPGFMVWENFMLQDQIYNDVPGDYVQSIAFGFAGDMQIELIQPLSGVSTYSDFLTRNPKGGVQHLGVLVDEFDSAVADMTSRGYAIVQSGRNGETRLAYFDTDRDIGILTEIVYLAPEERAKFEAMKGKRA